MTFVLEINTKLKKNRDLNKIIKWEQFKILYIFCRCSDIPNIVNKSRVTEQRNDSRMCVGALI
jgi:hypothetical protein